MLLQCSLATIGCVRDLKFTHVGDNTQFPWQKNENENDNDDSDNDENENHQQNAANKAVMPYTRYLSLAQLHHFQQVCDYWISGMFSYEIMMMPHHNHHDDHDHFYLVFLDPVQENNTVQLLAKKEFIGYDVYFTNMRPLIDSIASNDFNSFRFFLLN